MVKTPQWPVDRFRDLIDRIQQETGLPQAQLAALVPMDQSQLSRWKSGSSKPRYESLLALGTALAERYPDLGIGPEELTGSVYAREAILDATLPSLEAGAHGTVKEMQSARPVLPPELGEVKDPTTTEEVMLAALTAMQKEISALRAKIDEQNAKLDALASDHEWSGSGSREQKSA